MIFVEGAILRSLALAGLLNLFQITPATSVETAVSFELLAHSLCVRTLVQNDRRCDDFVHELKQILSPHPRHALTNKGSAAYATSCQQNHLGEFSQEVADGYLVALLHQENVEQAFAYFLVNLRVELHRPTADNLLTLAERAVASTQSATADSTAKRSRQALRLLALLSHNHALETLLTSPIENDRTHESLAALYWVNFKHYYGTLWKEEMAQAIRRGYLLIGAWSDKHPEQYSTASYWLSAFLACELANQGFERPLTQLSGKILHQLLTPNRPSMLTEFNLGADLGSLRCQQ